MSTKTAIPSYQNQLQGLRQQLAEMLPKDKLVIFNQDARQLAADFSQPLKLHAGDKAPLFVLPNATGKKLELKNLLQQGAVVLTFYRGVWCPYCNLQLKMYQSILPKIKLAGASLVAISPMKPDATAQMQSTNELQFEVLSDIGNKVASEFVSINQNPQTSIQAMTDLGYDFHSFYADRSAGLPVPATFVIARNGTILFASSAGGDYRERVEPQAILEALGA